MVNTLDTFTSATAIGDTDLLHLKVGTGANSDKSILGSIIKSLLGVQSMVIPIGDKNTNLSTGSAKETFRMSYGFYVSEVRASLGTAATGAAQSSGTVTCASVIEGGVQSTGTVTCATVLADDTVTVNGLVYTAVAGAKADNTEFSVDVGNDACATDLADSITNDVRIGVTEATVKPTAAAIAAVVTITADLYGTVGDNVDLSSSDGATLAVSGANLAGGVDNGTVTVTVNGLVYTAVDGAKSDNTEFSVDTGDNDCATDLADSITNDTRTGTDEASVDQIAAAIGPVVTITAVPFGTIGDGVGLASSDGGTLAVSGANLENGGDAFTVDIQSGGVSILSTLLTIDPNEKTSTTATTPAVISAPTIPDDNEITIDISTIGSTIPGKQLKVTLIGWKTS